MAKKYTDNYKLNMAVKILLSSLESYEAVFIHDVIKLESGDGLSKHQMANGLYPVYGGGGKTENNHNKYNIDFETIGIGRVGARCGCVFTIEKKSWVTDNALYAKEIDSRFSLKFLKHFLNYSNLNQYANNAMQPVISKTGIKSVKIPLLPLTKQIELGDFIDELENNVFDKVNCFPEIKSKFEILNNIDAVEIEYKKQCNLLSLLRQSILQEAIKGMLTEEWRKQNPNNEPASELLKKIKAEKEQLIKDKKIKKEKPLPPIEKDEIPFELPETWSLVYLDELAIVNGGFAFKSSEYVQNGVRVIRISDFDELGFKSDKIVRYTFSKELTPFVLEVNNILMAMTGGTVGKSYFVRSLPEIMVVNQRVATIKIIEPIKEQYINYVLSTPSIQKVIQKAKNSTNDNISMNDIKGFKIPIPPLNEQEAIIEIVESVLKKCENLNVENEKINKYCKDLMKALFSETFSIENK